MTRTEQIEAILGIARKRCPAIVPSVELEFRHADGRVGWYRCTGSPIGFKYTGQKRITGYVYQSRDGCTYGTRAATEQELIDAWEADQDRTASEFRAILEKCSDQDLERKFAFWTNEYGKPRPSLPPLKPTRRRKAHTQR